MTQDTRTLWLDLPRVVEGIPQNARKVDRVAVLDRVPVPVRSVLPAHAPLVLRRELHEATQRGRMADGWRLHDGALYQPLDYDSHVHGITPEELPRALLDRITADPVLARRGASATDQFNRQPLADWESYLKGASPHRGLVPADRAVFRRIDGDGRSAQADVVASLGANLLLVGDHLHHRTITPGYVVQMLGAGKVHVSSQVWHWIPDGLSGFQSWSRFPAAQRDAALAFARALAAETAEPGTTIEVQVNDFLVPLEPAALDALCGPPSAAALARGSLPYFLEEARSAAGYLSDEGIDRFKALRGLSASPGGEEWGMECFALMRALVDEMDPEGESRTRQPHMVHDDPCLGAAALGRHMLIRFDTVEGPRNGLSDEDSLALGGLTS